MIKVLPYLSLYVHIPWCIRKCFYCDFNSYEIKHQVPQEMYIKHLLIDLKSEASWIKERKIKSIFIGGGTPSLLDVKLIKLLLNEINNNYILSKDVEITLEINPETISSYFLEEYKNIGINRVSVGVQSFDFDSLVKLNRIRFRKELLHTINIISLLDFRTFNIDLMYSLPNQTFDKAIYDLKKIISFSIPHISWYQLSIEKNTYFNANPPILPNEDEVWKIFSFGNKLLKKSGYQQYEISSYVKESSHVCQHNLNYWNFGDYIGIGCGAHGKISFPNGRIFRKSKMRNPKNYMSGKYLDKIWEVKDSDKPFEFFLNCFRLNRSLRRENFSDYTGLQESKIRIPLNKAIKSGYIIESDLNWNLTKKGKLFLNNLLSFFI